MNPLTSLRNLTPSSTAASSFPSTIAGTAVAGFQMLHGHGALRTRTDTVGPGDSILPLSSIARARMVTGPLAPTCQAWVHVSRPTAACHVTPLSAETSTRETSPSESDAVPVI